MSNPEGILLEMAAYRSGAHLGTMDDPTFNLGVAFELWRLLGPGRMLQRLLYLLKIRSGYLAWRLPMGKRSDLNLSAWLPKGIPADPKTFARQGLDGGRFFERPARRDCERAMRPKPLLDEVESALAGRWRYFEKAWHSIGFPPNWHFNPIAGRSARADRHWSRISDDDCPDIKLIWEPSRFAIAYKLVRAYALTANEEYPKAFWHLVEDWAEKNPPQQGPNWKCGQEAAFRVMAWCFALFGFRGSPHSTPEREAFLAALAAIHAARIEASIGYALSQKNNHAISEAVGLWTVGLLFPQFEGSPRWLGKGRRILEREARTQIYPDGSYIQHSANYHRLMLQDYLWAIRLGELNGERLSEELRRRVGLAAEFLRGIQDPESGAVPNYGANDGALVLPLTCCDFTDYRPVLNSVHFLLHGRRLYPSGPWDEELLWLFGADALDCPVAERKRTPLSAPQGGCYTLIGDEGWAFIRCARYKDRPSQADQLHFDLWLRGMNVVCDAGTYLYSGGGAWSNGLAGTATHNTAVVDAQDQMRRAGRFLWLDWSQGSILKQARSSQGEIEYWEGQHDGYERLGVRHRRGVLRVGEALWVVIDDLLADGTRHSFFLQWLLPDFQYCFAPQEGSLSLATGVGRLTVRASCSSSCWFDLVRAGETVETGEGWNRAEPAEVRGWRSPSYGFKEPALSMGCRAQGAEPVRWVTVFELEGDSPRRFDGNTLALVGEESRLDLRLAPIGQSPMAIRTQFERGSGGSETLSIGGGL